MAPVRLRCQLGGECGYETVALEYDQANHQVESHMKWAHSPHSGQPPARPPEVKFSVRQSPGLFLGLTRSQGETASQFLIRLRAAAAWCDFTVLCPSCRTEVSYSDSLVGHKLVADQQSAPADFRSSNNSSKKAETEELKHETIKEGEEGEGEGKELGGKQEGAEEPDGEQGEAVVSNEECSDSNLPELTITTVESLAPSSPIPEAPKEEETVTISIRKRRLNCHICGLSLKDRSHLYQHYSQKHYKTMLVKHIDQQDLKCHECGKQFSTFNVLVLHLGTVHNILGRKTPL